MPAPDRSIGSVCIVLPLTACAPDMTPEQEAVAREVCLYAGDMDASVAPEAYRAMILTVPAGVGAALADHESGTAGPDRVADLLVPGAAEVTSHRGPLYEQACEPATELERHHDLRTSAWNTPDDITPAGDRQSVRAVAEVRRLVGAA
jgi:hypothetical protein